MKKQGGFLITRIKQVGGCVFERILSEKNIDAFNGAQGRILYILWQKDGVPIIGEANMVQEFPEAFNRVLEVQRIWHKQR